MKYFSNQTEGYQSMPVFIMFQAFLQSHFVERNLEKTLPLLDDEIFGSGAGEHEVAVGKEQVAKLLKRELELFPESIPYQLQSFYAKMVTENIWDVFAKLDLYFKDEEGGELIYSAHFSCVFKLLGTEDTLASIHISKAGYRSSVRGTFPLKFATENTGASKAQEEWNAFRMMCQSMPGGIISGYAERGFPIYFVNERFLEMLGYSSYEEYAKEVEDFALNGIHPEDREWVEREIMHSYAVDTQYGIEYRIRKKDGTYLPVYDVGRKIVAPDKRELVVCVLFDMTENRNLLDVMKQESFTDELTGLYNRRGGTRTVEEALRAGDAYSFAIFDVDNLKLLNDKYNHQAGDHALKRFAELARKKLSRRTVIARFGGDEFIAFVPFQLDRRYIDRLMTALQEDYCGFISEHYPESKSSLSIGCITGTGKMSLEKLYQMADEQMYEVKKNGKRGHKIKLIEEQP